MKNIKFLPFYIISWIPLRGLFLISDVLFFIVYHILHYRREVVRTNLKNSFPKKSINEIIKIEKGFYKHFTDQSFEAVKTLSISEAQAKKRFTIVNPELIDGLYEKEKDVIIYCGHLGNWEWFAFLPLLFEFQTTAFYQQLSNAYFDEIMKLTRSRFGVICVESKSGYRSLHQLRQEKKRTLNLMLGDQSPSKDGVKYWTNFLGQETAFLIGADKIARKMDQAVVFPVFEKKKRGHYEVRFILIEDNASNTDNHQITQKYATALEEAITKSPELWLWSHQRWKLSKLEPPKQTSTATN